MSQGVVFSGDVVSCPSVTPSPLADVRQGSPLRRIGETCLWLIVIAVVVVGAVRLASMLRLVVLPTFLALILATLLAPPVGWLRRRGWPRAGAALAAVGVFVLFFVGLGAWLGPAVGGQFGELGAQLTAGVREVEEWLVEGPFDLSHQQVSAAVDGLVDTVRGNVGSLAQTALSGAGVVLSVIAGLLLAIVVLFFFLKDGDAMWAWALGLVPAAQRNDLREAGERAWTALAAFLRGQTLVALFDAVAIGLGLVITGVPLALPLAVIVFFSTYVPYLGAIAAGAAAVLVALVSQGLGTALIVLVIVLVVWQVEGNVIYPFVMGRALSVHPIVLLLGIVAGGVLGGVVGAIIATPVLAAASGVFDYVRDQRVGESRHEHASGAGEASPAANLPIAESDAGD